MDMSGTFNPIPNFAGVNAGQQFRQAINNALGGTVPITPMIAGGSVTGGTISGADVSSAVAASMLTDAALRTLASRATDAINFADYAGADPTGATDMAALVHVALTDARAQKKALRFPAGTWGLASSVTLAQGDVIFGDGPESKLVYIGPTIPGAVPTLLSTPSPTGAISPPASGSPLVLSNLHIVGPWNGTTVTTQLNGAMIAIRALDSVLFDRVFVEYAPNVSISAAYCRSVRAVNCKLRYGARDGLQFEGSAFVEVIGGEFDHLDDNVISAHSTTNQVWSLVSSVVIMGIRAADCAGISAQGAHRINIAYNVIERPKQIGIEVAFVGASLIEGESAPLAVRIVGNHITDVINRQNIDALDTECNYITIGSVPAQQGAANATVGVPGTNVTILPAIWRPATGQQVGVSTIDANGNIQTVTTAGTTAGTTPNWNKTLGGTTTDGTVVWTNEGPGIAAAHVPAGRVWAAGTPYVVGAAIVDANGNVQECTASGTSGANTPSWAAGYGATTSDGTVTWTNQGANAVGGTVASPYSTFDNMKTSPTDTVTPIPPGWAIEISHNTCMRTIDTSANLQYSALGWGRMLTRNGWLDPLLGSIELVTNAHGINIFSYKSAPAQLRHVRISANHVQGMANAIAVGGGVVLVGADVHDNTLVDFATAGVNFSQANAPHRIDIRHNEFDGDPFLMNRGTAGGGAWQGQLIYPVAVVPNGCVGLAFRGNRLRNLMQVTSGVFSADAVIDRNILFCQPVAIGYNGGNLGIGTVPAAGAGYLHVIENCNPASPAFGQALNGPVLEASTAPSSGTYVQGQIVWNSASTASGNAAVLGWYRATTGSGNGLGTDWLPVYVDVSQVLSESLSGGLATVQPQAGGDALQVQGNGLGLTYLGSSGPSGSPVVFAGAQADGTLHVVAAGSSYACPSYVTTIYFTASGTIPTFAFTMPTTPEANGWKVRFSFNQAVTSLSMNHGTGQSFDGTHASVSAHQLVEYVWDATNAVWRMLQ
jgi:hypothetical protein